MGEVKKIPRLGKAASEFNVGISTIVSLLKKRNFEIVESPNTKLTSDMYDILIKEFQNEKLVKEESKKIDIGAFNKQKNDETPTTSPIEEEVVVPETEVIIKNTNVIEIPEQPTFTIETNTPKIIGKINIEELTPHKKVKTEKIAEPTTTEIIKTEETVNEEVITPSTTPIDEIESPSEPTIEEPIAPSELTDVPSIPDAIPTPPIEEIIPTTDTIEDETTNTTEPIQEEPIPIPEPVPVPSTPKEEEPTPHKKVPEHIDTVFENIGDKIKIIDKIDLDLINPKKKKKETHEKKTPKEQNIPTPEKKSPPKVESTPTPAPTEERKGEFLETKFERLKAPKIMGKIDLPTPKIKDPVKKEQPTPHTANQADIDKKKKKRKRIKQSALKQGGKDENGRPKLTLPPKVEISEEDIQRQIKETMQRLEPLGKSKTAKRRKEKRQHIHDEIKEHELQEIEEQKKLKVTEFITANELATLMNITVTKIIATCMSVGLFVSINQRLDAETISLLADEYGYQVEFVGADVEEEASIHEEDQPEDLIPRHPIITVMGHVDHGKTSLLDYIRKTNVIAGEAGGITQHIGAYEVQLNDGRKITFLDTPGHEAFTAMRARGAKITDLCIIVIAADDSIMPQTIEAINHAQAAGVPMVFAITKIDKHNANPEKIKEGLANMNILIEEWGGKYQCQEIDAKHGTNVNELLEKVLLEAEMLDLKANPSRHGIGTVIESALDKGKGYVAKVLVQNGTVQVGDPILAGSCYGKVKALYNERNIQITTAGPATPVLMLGLNGAPQAGDIFKVCISEHEARIAATKRSQLMREMGLRTQKHITLDEIGRRIAIGDFKELNIIVKGDVDGSVEALSDSLLRLSTEQVQVNVIHKSVGQVTESDVLLASASNAIIIAFQVRPSPGSKKLAEQEQIDIRMYSIIYTAINEIKDAIAGMHTPEIHEKILCNIEIREIFKITKVGNIAGCMVLDGKLQRNTKIRLIRDGIVIYTGKLGSLRRFKDDVKEVIAGQDCGLNIESFNDIKVGDIVEGYEEFEVKVTL